MLISCSMLKVCVTAISQPKKIELFLESDFLVLFQSGGRTSLIPFMGCMSSRSSRGQEKKAASSTSSFHAWDVIMKFYAIKGGQEYNAAPARKLSQSFGLDLSGSAANNRQSLLAIIDMILNTHEPYKRSADAMFKAFICAGLK